MSSQTPVVEVNSKQDLEQLREAYHKAGGCKLIHRSKFGNLLDDSARADLQLDNIRSWLNDDNPFRVNIDNMQDHSDNRDADLYTFAKFLWLAEDLRKNPSMIFPQGHRKTIDGIHRDDIVIHPGSIKVSVMEYLNMDYEVMMWDTHDWWQDVPTLTFEEWCDLLPIKRTLVEIRERCLEVWVDEGFRNKIYSWYYNFNNHVKNKFTIFIGLDSTHSHSAEKCARSIRRYNQDVNINFINIDDLPEYTRTYDKQTTAFTYSRFLVPYLMGYEGIGLFCDDDFVWNCDPLEVLLSFDYTKAVSCVQHNFTKDLSGPKMLDQKNVMYPRKNWSSLMLFNNAHPECANLTPEAVNNKSGQWLHRMMWASDVGKIPHTYNWCEGSCDWCTEAREPMSEAKVFHYTRGGPWLDLSLEWDHIKHIDKWKQL